MEKLSMLKVQVIKRLALSLIGEYKEMEYHGYNNYKAIFSSDWFELKLSDKTMIEIKVGLGRSIGFDYSDSYSFYGDYSNEQYMKYYDNIFKTKKVQTIIDTIKEYFNRLDDKISSFMYEQDLLEDDSPDKVFLDTDIFDTFINETETELIKKCKC